MHQAVSWPWVVVALGIETDHWSHVFGEFPDILNCCIDVRHAFQKEQDESTHGTGFDQSVRNRMISKNTWSTFWEAALVILQKFGLLVVLCNHGKHRSLSLVIELANYTGCECVSTRSISSPLKLTPIACVMADLRDSLRRHCESFGNHLNPIIGIGVCLHPFDGTAWAAGKSER